MTGTFLPLPGVTPRLLPGILALFVFFSGTDRVWSRQAPPVIQEGPVSFVHEDCTHRDLEMLKRSFDYERYVSEGTTEYARMILLKDWVYRQLAYSFSTPFPQLRNSLMILEKSDEGSTFVCTAIATLYMQCALSLGWTSRYVYLRSPDGQMHASVDIWSNQYNRWIYLDPTWNIHAEYNHEPVSLADLRHHWLRDDGRSLAYVFGAGDATETYYYGHFPVTRPDSELWMRMPLDATWLAYTYEIAYVSRNNFFTFADGTGETVWENMFIMKDILNGDDEEWPFFLSRPYSEYEVYHPLNRVDASVSRTPGKNELLVILRHSINGSFTPNFSHFEMMRRGKWVTVGDRLKIRTDDLKEGLHLRLKNRCGVAGPVTVIKN